MYAIEIDAASEMTRPKLDGFWTAEVMRRCREHLFQAMAHQGNATPAPSLLGGATCRGTTP